MVIIGCRDSSTSVITYDDHQLTPVAGHVSVGFDDKLVIVWGGYYVSKTSVAPAVRLDKYREVDKLYVYHTEHRKWLSFSTNGPAPPFNSGCCAVLFDRQIYIFGGFMHTTVDLEHQNASEEIRCLDLATLKWSTIEPKKNLYPSPRHKLVGWEYQNKLYFFGGFGPPPNSLNRNPRKTRNYLQGGGTFLSDNHLGYESSWNNQLVAFDLKESTWSLVTCTGTIASPRAAHAATKMSYDKVLIFGGRHQEMRLNDLYVLHLKNMHWTQVIFPNCDNIPCGRSWHCIDKTGPNRFLLYGGFTQQNQPLSDCWWLDTSSIEWRWKQKHCQKSNKRLWHTGVSVNERLYVYGGCKTNILDPGHDREYCNDLIVIPEGPPSLEQLCINSIASQKGKWPRSCLSLLLPSSLVQKIEFKSPKQFKKKKSLKLSSPLDLMLL